jgi:hexosaminidase
VPPNNPIPLLPTPRQITREPGTCRASPQFLTDPKLPPQGYLISTTPDHFKVVARDAQSHFYAQQTILQLRRACAGDMPCAQITDSPDFPVRGVLLDISRDKVPTLETLFQIVDWLAELKINQLQLYMEHTFAYTGHEEVWRDASPLTAADVRALDEYCKSRFIDLVPNQNSLGHMERWLTHPKYLPLAETPNGSDTPWGYRRSGPFSLCPTDPASLTFLAGLYSQLLPNFSSPLFNVGCDEAYDIHQGRSRGIPDAYPKFLQKISDLAASHHRRIQFWADGILDHPDWIPRIPQNATALIWGYEADHPFEQNAAQLSNHRIPFYVCPGTSSWCSIAGRTDNMLANQQAAAQAGLAHGAAGFLSTDWGDFGHLQYWPISFPGLATGAALSWCLDSNRNLNLPAVLDTHVFQDSARVMGTLACDLGNVYKTVGKLLPNRSALFSILVPSSTHKDPMEGITTTNLEHAAAQIAQITRPISQSKMSRPDANLIVSEYQNAAAMLHYACQKSPELLAQIQDSHRTCWLARNRPGGLQDSLRRLFISPSATPLIPSPAEDYARLR